VKQLAERGLKMSDILTPASIQNAMVVHAACGGSTNLLLHIPAVAFAAGLARPTVQQWSDINRRVPRFVSVLPNGPGQPSHRSRVPGRRCAGDHAAPARVGPLGTRRPHGERADTQATC
jgi:xylonate dehydratase